MANIFAITTATDDIKADAEGKASAVYTVTNTSNKPMRGIAKARTLGNTQQDWLSVEGETERDFSANGTQQFTVNFRKPPTQAAAGGPVTPEKFPFRLDVSSALNPDEQFTEGPTINVEVTPTAPKPPPKPFPWWIIPVIAGVLALVVGVILFFAFCTGGGKFAGTWVNAAPPAMSPTFLLVPAKLVIEQSGSDLKVRVFNRCAPVDCDMGISTGTIADNGDGKVLVDHGLIAHLLTIKEDVDGKIKVRVEPVPRYPALPLVPTPVEFTFNKQAASSGLANVANKAAAAPVNAAPANIQLTANNTAPVNNPAPANNKAAPGNK